VRTVGLDINIAAQLAVKKAEEEIES